MTKRTRIKFTTILLLNLFLSFYGFSQSPSGVPSLNQRYIKTQWDRVDTGVIFTPIDTAFTALYKGTMVYKDDDNTYYSWNGLYWVAIGGTGALQNWESTLNIQGANAFTADHTVDIGGKTFILNNAGRFLFSTSNSSFGSNSYEGLLTLSSTYRTQITTDTLRVSANTNNSRFIWNYGNLNIYDNSTNLNISIGQNAGDTLGIRNIFIGNKAGRRATGSYNVLLSTNAGQLTSQDGHVAIGRVADQFSNYGFNTSVGYQANSYGIKGWNTVIGANANSADVKYSTNLNTSVIVTSSSTISGATVATYITNAGLSVGDTSAYKVTFNGTIPLPYTDVTNPFKGVVTASNTITFLSTDNFTTTGSGTMTVSVYNKYDSTVVLGLDAMPTHSHQFALSPYIDTLYLAGVSSGTNYVLADVNGSKKFIPKDINSLVSQYWAANGNDIYNTNSGNVGVNGSALSGVALNVSGSTTTAIDATQVATTNGSIYYGSELHMSNGQTTAAGQAYAVWSEYNNLSDGSSTNTTALAGGILSTIHLRSNSTTPITTASSYDAEFGVINSRTQTITNLYGFRTLPESVSAAPSSLITSGGRYISFFADSIYSGLYSGGSAYGFYQKSNNANTIKNRFEAVTNEFPNLPTYSSGGNTAVVLNSSTGRLELASIGISNQSLAAYSFAANNTNATAAPTALVYEDLGIQTYAGTFTWDGTAPTTITGQTFRWIQIGKKVDLWLQVAYTNAGVTNTSCDVSWPSGVPVPIEPMGFTATNDVVAIGVATMQTSTSQQSTTGRECYIVKTGTGTYKLNVSAGSTSAKGIRLHVTYLTP